MSLYRYFKPLAKNLPDPEVSLSNEVPSSIIKAANDAVLTVNTSRQSDGVPKLAKRGPYVTLTGVQQAEVARYAVSHGNKAAISRCSKEYSVEIKDSSVSTWKSKYVKNLIKSVRLGSLRVMEMLLCIQYHRRREGGRYFWATS